MSLPPQTSLGFDDPSSIQAPPLQGSSASGVLHKIIKNNNTNLGSSQLLQKPSSSKTSPEPPQTPWVGFREPRIYSCREYPFESQCHALGWSCPAGGLQERGWMQPLPFWEDDSHSFHCRSSAAAHGHTRAAGIPRELGNCWYLQDSSDF